MLDALVVGGGPAGCAAAYWLARAGRRVVLAERKRYPREKVCGDGLTPRAIAELAGMGFDFAAAGLHRVRGLRLAAADRARLVPWPSQPGLPDWGAVVRRADLDRQLAGLAAAAGVDVREGVTAAPLLEGRRVAAVTLTTDGGVERLLPRLVIVADGALSRFGRQLGVARDRRRPVGLAARGYYRSARSRDAFLDVDLRVRDAAGRIVPGYGWVFPMGDGTVNLGAISLRSAGRWKGVNTSALLDGFAAAMGPVWDLDPEPLARPRGGMLAMGLASGPVAGPNWLVAGDAAGTINPATGEGISYALVTGRMAAGFAGAALATGDPGQLAGYRPALRDRFGGYYRGARAFMAASSAPGAMRQVGATAVRNRRLREATIRLMLDMRR